MEDTGTWGAGGEHGDDPRGGGGEHGDDPRGGGGEYEGDPRGGGGEHGDDPRGGGGDPREGPWGRGGERGAGPRGSADAHGDGPRGGTGDGSAGGHGRGEGGPRGGTGSGGATSAADARDDGAAPHAHDRGTGAETPHADARDVGAASRPEAGDGSAARRVEPRDGAAEPQEQHGAGQATPRAEAADGRTAPRTAPRDGSAGGHAPGGDGTGGEVWLPEVLTRLIARRSAAVLALPDVSATEVPVTAGDDGEATAGAEGGGGTTAAGSGGSPTRRRFLVLGSAAGVLAAAGTAAWWTTGRPGGPADHGGSAALPRLTLAVHADLSGGGRTTGRAQENGVRLAVDRLNSRTGRTFQLALQVHDDRGEPSRAQEIARRLAADDRVRAVLGPSTDACAQATLALYQKALLPMVSVSVGLDDVSAFTYRVYAATRPNDATLVTPLLAYLVHTADARRTVLVDDAAEGDFSWRLCSGLAESLGAVRTVIRRTLAADAATDGAFRALAEAVTAAGADAVVFGGGYARAARLARALRKAGFSGARLATERACDTRFLRAAGDAADGWVFATSYLDPARVTAAKPFVTAYRARFGTAPPPYAAEAYDATLFVAGALTALGPDRAERGAVVGRLRETDYRGITKQLHYTASSTRYSRDAMYLFRASGNAFRYLGQYADATAASTSTPSSTPTSTAAP
uniref:branched-chain amino acid ABC transporter substrate-binding protein n=1 Tax=Streptomyces sp. SS7 TaxID=3108485 RepID=UPI00403FDDDF